MRRVFNPYHQGDLDGLCGIYGLINAASFLCSEMDKEAARDLFRVLNEKLRKLHGTSAVVWGGMCPALMWPMLRVTQSYLREQLEIRVTVQELAVPTEKLYLGVSVGCASQTDRLRRRDPGFQRAL